MKPDDLQTITRLLGEIRAGEVEAAQSLVPLVYGELKALARRVFEDQRRRDHTLQPTALVHEAWLKIAKHVDRVADRKHFLAVASRAMRQVLTDHARSRDREKRGRGRRRITIDGALLGTRSPELDLVDLEDLLNRLASLNARHARVVELRILGGLTIAEAASVLGVGHSTIEEDWFMAKAWLRAALGDRA